MRERAWVAASVSACFGVFDPRRAFCTSVCSTWLISLYLGTCGRAIRLASSFLATGTICGGVARTCESSYDFDQHGRELLAYLFWTAALVRYVTYVQAAFWFLLPELTHSAIEPLTPGPPAGPVGVVVTPTLPATFDWAGSLAALNMYVQLSAIAAWPSEKIFRTSSSSDSSEFLLLRPTSSVCFMNSSACRPPPVSNATDLPSSERNLPPYAPSSCV